MNMALNEHSDELNDGIWTRTLEMLALFLYTWQSNSVSFFSSVMGNHSWQLYQYFFFYPAEWHSL